MLEAIALGALAWALTYLVHSTVLLGATWGLLRLVRRFDAPLRARAWQAALVGGILTASVQLGAGLEPLGGRFVLPQPTAATVEPARARVELPATELLLTRAPRPARPSLGATLPAAPPTIEVAPNAAETRSQRVRRAIAVAWICGALWGLLRFATRAGNFRSHVADRLPVWDERALASLERLRRRAGVRRNVALSRSRTIRVPLTWGVLRPEICVPDRALADLSAGEFEAVLAHELGHVARGDALWLGLGQWLGAILFFQPLNRVGRRGLAREAEHLADAFAVRLTRRPVTLARCLAKVAGWLEHAAPRNATAEVAVAGMASSRGVLRERVERLLEHRTVRRPRRAATVAVVSAPLLLLPLAPAVAADRAPDDASSAARAEAGTGTAALDFRGAAREPSARTSSDTGGHVAHEFAPFTGLLEELTDLRAEVAKLGGHPAADRYAPELALLGERLDRLAALADRALAHAATADTTTPSRNASRDDALSFVPERP